MKKPKTLNELRHLEDSGFGRCYPRHGLKLLYWFANDCVNFNVYKNMCWRYDPEGGCFGFHPFKNRIERNGEKLLPDVDFPYYEVGNLSKYRADELPDYVLEDYEQNPGHCQSNMERIIISVDDEFIDRVYVTEHIDQSDFNKEATYCISRNLIKIIRRLTIEELLEKTGYYRQQEETYVELGEWTDQEESHVELGEWTDQKESDQETEYLLNQREDTYRNYRRSGPVVKVDNGSFRNDTGSENCCNCVIL